jgi:hypothetical protein
MSDSEIKDQTLKIIRLMKDVGIFGNEPNLWRPVHVPSSEPKTRNFVDKGTIDDFYGTYFRLYGEDGTENNYFNPPSEIGLEHDNLHGSTNGFWKKYVPREIKAVRTLVETGIAAPKSSSELRSWDARKISKYLLGESENYEALYACIIAQLENVHTDDARNAIEQLSTLLETTTEPVSRTKALHIDEDEEEISRGFESMNIKPKARAASPKTKATSPKTKAASPKTGTNEKMDKLIEKYRAKLSNKESTASVADAIKRLAEELGLDSDFMEEQYDFYGFGRSRLKPFRRTSRRRSNKKTKTLIHRTSKAKRKVRTSGGSLKKNKRRTSKRKTTKKLTKSFGSSIYGLQGGMQNGPLYAGVYPMTLKVNETLPNLNNVKRTYTLNEFGSKKNKSPRRRTSKETGKVVDRRGRNKSNKTSMIATVVDSRNDDGGSSFGCGGCGSCGRSFGCGCGAGAGSKEEEE